MDTTHLERPKRIELPTRFGMQTVNSYFFELPVPTLIDCGEKTDESYEALKKGLQDLGFGLSDIERIIITHAHVDHVGGAKRILDEAPKAKLYTNEIAAPVLITPREQMNIRFSLHNTLLKDIIPDESPLKPFFGQTMQFLNSMMKRWDPLPAELVNTIEIDTKIDLGNAEWTTIYAPGHSKTQTIFFQEKSGHLLSADMLLRVTPTPIIDDPKAPKAILTLIDSYKKLQQLDIKKVYPGHYREFNNAQEVIKNQLMRIERRTQECHDYIKQGVNQFDKLLVAMYKDKLAPPTIFMLKGYIDILTDQGAITFSKEQKRYVLQSN